MTIQDRQIGDAIRPVFAVRLIDRDMGQPYHVNGAPLLALRLQPEPLRHSLVDGRDPALWEARIELLNTHTHQ